MVLLLLLSAAAQLNDPDPVSWVLFYAAAAALSVLQLLGRSRSVWWRSFALLALFWAGSLLPSVVGQVGPTELFQSMDGAHPEIELGREAGGLVLVALWSLVAGWRDRSVGR